MLSSKLHQVHRKYHSEKQKKQLPALKHLVITYTRVNLLENQIGALSV